MKRSRVLAILLAAVLLVPGTGPGTPAPASASAAAGVDYRCVMDAFGHTASGRIKFRRVVNSKVTVAKATAGTFAWRPMAWGLVSSNSWPGYESTEQIVASTDGRIRLVSTEWRSGSSNLRVRVLKVVGSGYPSRLVAFDEFSLFWVAADHSLNRATWNGRRLTNPTKLPVTITGARAMTAKGSDRGMHVYYTDTRGRFHVVTDKGAATTDIVLRQSSGFATTTGLRAGHCHSTNYAGIRSYLGILAVNRETGGGRFMRALRPDSADGGSLTSSTRVSPAGWTWRRLG